MCGIAGAFSIETLQKSRSIVEQVIESQFRRGPDNRATFDVTTNFGHIILGHNRLSIIDLSTDANQPMWDWENNVAIVFNGEIYNYLELRSELQQLGHRFKTSSDTEVILEAYKEWGLEHAINKFNGMFAFAIFDRGLEQLFLARDRFGVKPLYYFANNREFYFASTGKVIAKQMNLQPNLEYVSRGLKYWIYEDDSDISQYENLLALPAGHLLEVKYRDSQIKLVRQKYYDLEENVQKTSEQLASLTENSLLELVQNRLDHAIDLRLRSDVPIGISLSGGLDSSTIAALLAQKHTSIKGFSFSDPDDLTSEGPLVHELIEKIHSPITYIKAAPKRFSEIFWETLQAQDAPFAGESIIAQNEVFRVARSEGIRVMLGGQGGDEIFMGYRKFQLFRLRQLLHSGKILKAADFALSLLPLLVAETSKLPLYWAARNRYTNKSAVVSNLILPKPNSLSMGFDVSATLWKRQVYDVTKFSLPTLLRYEDRNSMGNSIESRLPFLDFKLIETAIALPEALKLRHGHGKWIIRKMMTGQLPENIRLSKLKRGFDVNQANWIDGGLGTFLRDQLEQRANVIRQFVTASGNINMMFSDENLKKRKITFAEVVSLLWLAERAS
jgi:asparagine synthase (glutamine-hydrolysing)